MPMAIPRWAKILSSRDQLLKQRKELYEPLWLEIHARSKANGFGIRGIWIADMTQQGASGILNEYLIGDDRKSYLLLNKSFKDED
jgi:hypothetical protein